MTQIAIARSVRTGMNRSASRTVPPGVQTITIAMDSDWLASYDLAMWGVEASFDGGATWLVQAAVPIKGGNVQGRTGNLPSIVLGNPPPGLYRLFLLLSNPADIGVTIDVV